PSSYSSAAGAVQDKTPRWRFASRSCPRQRKGNVRGTEDIGPLDPPARLSRWERFAEEFDISNEVCWRLSLAPYGSSEPLRAQTLAQMPLQKNGTPRLYITCPSVRRLGRGAGSTWSPLRGLEHQVCRGGAWRGFAPIAYSTTGIIAGEQVTPERLGV